MVSSGHQSVNLQPEFFPSAGTIQPGETANSETYNLLPGRAGVFQTADAMTACVKGEIGPDHNGFQSEAVNRIAKEIETIFFGQSFAQAVFSYAQFCLQYDEHPFDVQICQDAVTTYVTGKGDCVSMSVFIATLLASRGIPVCFVFQDVTGSEYTHVYCEALINRQLVALDAVSKEPMGWRQPLLPSGFETTWLISNME